MLGNELKPLFRAAESLLADQLEDRIQDALNEIEALQRKVTRLRRQKVFFSKALKELQKPPKPFKVPKLTKAQRKRLEKLRRQAVPTAVMASAVGM